MDEEITSQESSESEENENSDISDNNELIGPFFPKY